MSFNLAYSIGGAAFWVTTLWLAGLADRPAGAFESNRLVSSESDVDQPTPAWAPEYVQGEYRGQLLVDGRWFPYALQVIARGADRFDANLLRGDLPTAGLLAPYAVPMTSQVKEQQLSLKSEGGLVFHLTTDGVYGFEQRSSDGSLMGKFTRVQRQSASLGMSPPPGAKILFRDGKIGELSGAKLTESGHLARGAVTSFPVNDFRLHLEFRLPFQPEKSNQDRGNSGVYMQRRYEVQILDSFGEKPVANNAASLYRQRAALGNMSLPPLAWQTYDIWFTAAQWSADGEKLENARVTVAHNGVIVQRDQEIEAKTGAGQPEGPDPKPILFQDHSDPVEFRNIWLVELPRKS